MKSIKVELVKLNDSLDEEKFDLFEFLDAIQVIDKQVEYSDIFSSFCNIWGTEEAQDWDEFDEDTMNFVNQVQDAPFVDVEKFKEMYLKDIKERLEIIINTL